MKKFKKFKKSIIAFLLAFVVVLPMTGCGKESSVGYATVDDVEFWGTYAAESILQDLHGVYDEFKFEPTIDLTVLKGEEEADKIIMTTGEKPIKNFDVEITDLKSGNDVFSKEDIDIYQVLYTYVGSKEFYKYEGYYPDGLAPIEGTKMVKENNVNANSNQGIYVSFNVPVDQPRFDQARPTGWARHLRSGTFAAQEKRGDFAPVLPSIARRAKGGGRKNQEIFQVKQQRNTYLTSFAHKQFY